MLIDYNHINDINNNDQKDHATHHLVFKRYYDRRYFFKGWKTPFLQ